MRKRCNCAEIKLREKNDINISTADVNLKKHNIEITITREPDTPTIAELRRQITELQELGLQLSDIDARLADALSGLDIATKAYLAEILESYSTKAELATLHDSLLQALAAEREWANGRFLQKVYLSQEAYNSMSADEKSVYNGNVMYIITD